MWVQTRLRTSSSLGSGFSRSIASWISAQMVMSLSHPLGMPGEVSVLLPVLNGRLLLKAHHELIPEESFDLGS